MGNAHHREGDGAVQQAGGGGGGVVAAGEWRWLTVAGAVAEVVFGE